MDKKTINTAIIDDIIEKLQKAKEHEKIGLASYTRLAEITRTVNVLLYALDDKYNSIDSDL